MPIRRRKLPDLKLFNEFLNSEEEERNIENFPAAELQQLAKKFVPGVRKKNGEEYEPSSLRRFLQSIDRYLRRKRMHIFPFERQRMNSVIVRFKISWKRSRKGNKLNSKCRCTNVIANEEIEEFYLAGVLGNKTPRALLNTVWMNNGIYFGRRPGACFSKSPVTLRARNQIFKSKYKE